MMLVKLHSPENTIPLYFSKYIIINNTEAEIQNTVRA